MKGNITIPELPFAEEVWLMVAVTSVRERRTQQGKPFRDANARNATGSLLLKVWGEVLEGREDLRPGLWGVTGKLEAFQDRTQFVVSEYRPITIEQYREYVGCDPLLPRAFTLDIETLALPGFRDRVGPKLERDFRLGYMRTEQQQRYLEDIAAEEERVLRYEKPDLYKQRAGGVWDAYIRMEGVKEFYQSLKDKVEIVLPLRRQPYGDWEFEVNDPNGYVLVFSELID